MSNFIDHSPEYDPEASIKEIENVNLEQQYDKLTSYEKDLVAARILGYKQIPATSDQFIEDEYYLGGEKFFNHGDAVFDYWKNVMRNEIFKGRFFTKKPYIIRSGGVGTGKSTLSRICMGIIMMRMFNFKNIYKSLHIVPKPLTFFIAHRKEESAINEWKNWFLKDVLNFSPFFHNTRPNFKYKILTGGPRSSMGIGNDVIYYNLGELAFWENQQSAKEKATSAIIRFKSRFSIEQLQQVGLYIVDSSPKDSGSAVDFVYENVDRKYLFYCSPAHYEVRPNMYKESKGKTFKVYTGDGGSTPPQIIPKDQEMDTSKFDPSKIIEVPIQLLGEYKADLIKSLQDLSGVPTGSNALFFEGNISCIKDCSTIVNKIPEVITVDFYDKNDKLIDKIKPMISMLAPRKNFYIGLDLSASRGGDATGISGVTFEGWKDIDGTKMPQMRCWFMVAIKNKSGQEISLFHIEQLINDLNKTYHVIVSADQAFSKGILQNCERENITTNGRISTDIVPCEPAIYLKYILRQELIQIPENLRFQREAADLYYTDKGKIDHPKKASLILDNRAGTEKGSKDVWDSLCQAVYSCKMSLDKDEYYEGFEKELQLINRMTEGDSKEKSREVFQGMLESIY